MNFSKMHGLGNDFVVVDGGVAVTPALVRALCDRRFGVGADGLLQVGFDSTGVRMGYWNGDGSSAEMCGNGLRCVARRAWDLGLVDSRAFVVTTAAGPKRVVVGDADVSVDLGPISIGSAVDIDGLRYECVDVGNPHAVAAADPDLVDVAAVGSRVEHHQHFPNATNVEFYSWVNPGHVRMRVWERGVGETLACGSGMVAVAAVARGDDEELDSITVDVPGGRAVVDFGDGVWLTGPAVTVFDGVWLSEPS
jgi:diaminopimelate epimerase